MSTKKGDEGLSAAEAAKKMNTRQTRGTNSKNNSRNNSPRVSPNRNKSQKMVEIVSTDETWTCEACHKNFSNPNDKLLECQRCKDHYCIVCLDKSVAEYDLLSSSDLMWFCISCREKVEKNIITDRKIEDTCRDMMKAFEERIGNIETSLAGKCSKDEAREIVREEMGKQNKELKDKQPEAAASKAPSISQVVNEIKERESRADNFVIYKATESEDESMTERVESDFNTVLQIAETCGAEITREDIKSVVRLGHRKPSRPLLVQFHYNECKAKIFKGIRKLRDDPNLKDVRVVNDLTKAERDEEQKLYNQAKELTEKESGEFTYRVRGPPWARKIKKLPKNREEESEESEGEAV